MGGREKLPSPAVRENLGWKIRSNVFFFTEKAHNQSGVVSVGTIFFVKKSALYSNLTLLIGDTFRLLLVVAHGLGLIGSLGK